MQNSKISKGEVSEGAIASLKIVSYPISCPSLLVIKINKFYTAKIWALKLVGES